MRTIAHAGEHTTRTVFGPNASYFTITSSGYSWQNLPSVLEHDIIGRMKKGFPTNVALGIHGAFVVLYGDGNVTFDVATYYPAVDAMIRNSTENARRKGISFIALNPHAAGQYYVAYGDGSASWNLPNEWSGDVTTVSRSLRPVTSTSPASTSPSLGGFTAAGGTTSTLSPLGQAVSKPTPSAASMGLHAAQGLGKLWNAYQQQQNGGNSSPFATQTSFFDSSSVTSPFDPSTLVPGFDPTAGLNPGNLAGGIAGGIVAGMDPNGVVNTISTLLGNS
ncbi:hypothetical protein C8R44DRAFT_6383 [Mycena epipterygia]|nr:hypothetical protein C8R44DRAFT_6383 [Mycena epipterygia]